jgi:hypothetical protein
MSTQAAGGAAFTSEQVLRQAQGNATAAVLVTIAYLNEWGFSAEEWVAFTGQRFAPAWEELRGPGAAGVARIAALNVVSLGGELVALSGDAARAEAVVRGWPPPAMLDFVRLAQDEADSFYAAFGPIAAHLGLHFAWHREDDHVVLVFER